MSRLCFQAPRRGSGRPCRLVWLAVLLAPALAAPRLEALDPVRALTQYRNDHWQTEQGLPQSTVQAITQTRDGYLWVGTLDGLARFDGMGFKLYDARTIPELGSGSVLGLMQDADGNLWIGRSGAAVIYRDGRFRVAFGEALTGGATVWSFCQSRDGAVWAATNAGLVRWMNGDLRVFRKADGLPTDKLRSVTIDRDGTLWIGTTGGGLVSYAKGRFEVRNPASGFPHAEVRAVLADPDGGVWAATAGGGLARVANGTTTAYTTVHGLPTNQLAALARDAQGTLWIGTWGSGLCRLRDGRFSCLSSAEGLGADQVWSLFSDREDNLWVGTWVGGLNRLRDRRFLAFGAPEGLSSNNARAVLRARDGAIWVATAGGGVNRIDGTRVTVYRVTDGLPSDEASALGEDRDGAIWIGTNTAGAARLKDGHITRFGVAEGLPGTDIRALMQDRAGTLWAGGVAGLARFDGRRFVAVPGDGVSLESIVAMFEDHEGTLWVGTSGNGLLARRDGRFRQYTTRDGLPSNKIMSFHEDARGSLWIGTGGGGIARLRDGRIVAIGPKDGLWDGYAEAFLEDRAGTAWITCNRGFFSVPMTQLDAFADGRADTVTPTAYGASDALRSTTFAGGQAPSGVVDSQGRLWLPSHQGLVVVDPAHIPPRGGPPTVRVEETTVNGVVHDPGRGVRLPSGAGTLTIRYTAVTLVDGDRVRFRWRMEGLSPDWVSAGTGREAFYPSLRHGTYRFQVAASVDGATWGETSGPLEVVIEPYFYETAWFAVLSGLCLVGGISGGIWWRLKLHRRIEAELQQRVALALHDVQTLRGMLPICAWCKKVRTDEGYWEQIEVYLRAHSEARFSHGICPDCVQAMERNPQRLSE